ncbi:MAG: hypothetical protein FD174_380 [Geobacteraceae bacterium]|nr:MAG: hypothetical protein FD174_380 [Geobacteraceae bacterium]
MKCPKCGYNSFEFLDSCKKCSNDLVPFKESHGIRAVILPFRRPSPDTAPPETTGFSESVMKNPSAPNTEDIFTWDTPAETVAAKLDEPLSDPATDLSVGKCEAEMFRFDLEQSPAAAEEPQKGANASFGEFSFEEIIGENEDQTPATGDAENPLSDDTLADLLESGPTAGSQVEEPPTAIFEELVSADAGKLFEEKSLADLLESGPAAGSQVDEPGDAIFGELESADAGNPFAEESLAGLLESGPVTGSRLEEPEFATPEEIESTDTGTPVEEVSFADFLESAPSTGTRLEPVAAATTDEFAVGELQVFEEGASQEELLVEESTESAASVEDFDFEQFFLEEEVPPANPAKGPAIDSLGLSKDEFDSLFGDVDTMEKEKLAQ